jgi:hypothetical protein
LVRFPTDYALLLVVVVVVVVSWCILQSMLGAEYDMSNIEFWKQREVDSTINPVLQLLKLKDHDYCPSSKS